MSPLALMFQYQTGIPIGELVTLWYENIETPNYIHMQRMFRRDAREIVENTKSQDGDRQVNLTEAVKDNINAARRYQTKHGYDSNGFIFARGQAEYSKTDDGTRG